MSFSALLVTRRRHPRREYLKTSRRTHSATQAPAHGGRATPSRGPKTNRNHSQRSGAGCRVGMFYSRHTRERGNGAAWRAPRKTRVTRGGQAPQRLPLPGQGLGDGARCVWCIAVKGHPLALWRTPSGPLGRIAARGSRGRKQKGSNGKQKGSKREANRARPGAPAGPPGRRRVRSWAGIAGGCEPRPPPPHAGRSRGTRSDS